MVEKTERKDKSAHVIRNVVYGFALFVAAIAVVTLFINFIHLQLFSPYQMYGEWKEFQNMTAGLFMAAAGITVIGVAFSVVSLKIEKLRFASVFVLVGLALVLIAFSIVHVASTVGYMVGKMPEWEFPLRADSPAVTYTATFAAAALQPAVCFIAMAVCALFKYISDKKRAALEAAQNESEAPQESKKNVCKECGKEIDEDDKFCVHCGAKRE
ncbi:MAG: zinc ribbon domain-containing protein [Clostridiales bacterium]|nr:zinc ribbon domain-containing protein [Clostridiales bacterium]